MSDEERRQLLIKNLSGPAMDCYAALDDFIKKDYEKLCSYLLTNFGTHKTHLQIMSDWNRTRQYNNETLNNFLISRYNEALRDYERLRPTRIGDDERKLELAHRLKPALS